MSGRALSTTGVPKGSTTKSIQARQANINVAALLPGAAPPRARSPQPGRTAQAPRPQPDAKFESKKPPPEHAGPKVNLDELRNVRQDLKFAAMPKGKSYVQLEHNIESRGPAHEGQ
ncbi:PREDICTED: small muscular protein-like [Branchiostoma belcheri]|uniref:Small muscular protein-like n=1 Tax=Branchiostoma belcheri TaxID=7741 RepID=A0A6P4ZN65_BRABE|nr:PREDICTED: small muscular protein-like [Branchiostoma belcheri]